VRNYLIAAFGSSYKGPEYKLGTKTARGINLQTAERVSTVSSITQSGQAVLQTLRPPFQYTSG
jgi:hypothetical protein